MRRYLNLNQLSQLFVQVIGVLMVVVPAVLYGIILVWGENEIIRTFVMRILKVSIVAGAFVLVVFLVLIVVEQVQDHYIDARYQKQRNQKTLLGSGYYECQYCGNRRVKANDKTCDVCRRDFE